MNIFSIIGTAAKLAGTYLSGGVGAAVTALGAIAGDKAVKIIEPIMDYAIFDPENGYFQDFPDRKNDNYVKRVWRIMTYDEGS